VVSSLRFSGKTVQFATLSDIQAARFGGFLTIAELQRSRCSQVPNEPGVYLILRPDAQAPIYLPASIGGRFKGKDPTLAVARLASQWVPDSCVIYIGKASVPLRHRLRLYMDFGLGKAVAHRGGRCIWQMADSGKLLVAWKVTSSDDPALVEAGLIQAFKARYARRPFANLRD
jgi:hypothetical protein